MRSVRSHRTSGMEKEGMRKGLGLDNLTSSIVRLSVSENLVDRRVFLEAVSNWFNKIYFMVTFPLLPINHIRSMLDCREL